MRTFLRWIVLLVMVPVLLAAAGSVVLRQARSAFGTAFEVRPGTAEVLFPKAHVYAYAARAGDRLILFDTGPDPEGTGIEALLQALHAERNQVEDIFVTHGHSDHVAALALFPQSRIHAGAGDVDTIAQNVRPGKFFPALLAWLAPCPPATVTDALNSETEVPVSGGAHVTAIPVPGHTPGSYAFVYQGVLFTGDTLSLDHGRLGVGPKLFTEDRERQAESIHQLQARLAQVPLDMICTGHGGCSPSGEGSALLGRATSSLTNLAPLF